MIKDDEGRPLFDADEIHEIIFQWLDLIKERAKEDHGKTHRPYEKIAATVDMWKLAADKSNYLARRLYMGQKHRTQQCPQHHGNWSGYAFPLRCECSLGTYDITGWLPAPGDETERLGVCDDKDCEAEATVEWVILKTGERRIYCPEHK